ncbi:MAG: hypothetical protein R3B55_02580 [Candidatus Paceibacterota bacterium]
MNTIKWVLLVAIAIILVVVFTGKDKKEDMMEDTLVMEENAVLLWTNSQRRDCGLRQTFKTRICCCLFKRRIW